MAPSEAAEERPRSGSAATVFTLLPLLILGLGSGLIRAVIREPAAFVAVLALGSGALVIQAVSLERPGALAMLVTVAQIAIVLPLLPAACILWVAYGLGCARTEWVEGVVVWLGGLIMVAGAIAVLVSGAKFLISSRAEAREKLLRHLVVANTTFVAVMGILILGTWDTTCS